MAIVNKRTECLRVVTIGYLRNFIGDLIKDSNGEVVHINTTAKDDYDNDEYCPTYSELTGGTLIPNHVEGSTPSDDVDGIAVNRVFYNDGVSNYKENQLVNQKDLSVIYTTFNEFSISVNPTTISECGGNSTLGYTYSLIRHNKYMTSECVTASTSTQYLDTQSNKVIWTTSDFGSLEYPTFVVSKNGSVSANSRTTSVGGKVVFRGVAHTDSKTVTQQALTGGYTSHEGRHYTGVTVTPSTVSAFGCEGGSFYITGVGYYFDRYNWVDSCNVEYNDVYNDVEGTEDAGRVDGSFERVVCPSGTPESAVTLTKRLTMDYHGNTDYKDFTLSCNSLSCDCTSYDSEIVYTPVTVTCSAGTVTVLGQHTHYEATGWDASGNCIYVTSVVGDSYTVNYSCNPTNTIRHIDDYVTQAAGPCCCNGNVSATGTSWDYNQHTNVVVGTYTILDAQVANLAISESPSWLTNVQLNQGSNNVTASMSEIPCEQSSKEGSVILSFTVNGEPCSASFTVTQAGNPTQCPCTAYSYSVTCLCDSPTITCDASDLQINLTSVPCNSMEAQLSLVVKRKCDAPHATSYEPYNNYTVQWSLNNNHFLIENPNSKTPTLSISANCTNSARSSIITATVTVDDRTITCTSTITQQAGPCDACS